MEQSIKENLIIDDIEKVQERMQELCGFEIDVQRMVDFINQEENTVFCFDPFFNSRELIDKDANFVCVDPGYTYAGEAIFISLIKREPSLFTGYFIGTAKNLIGGISSHNPSHSHDIRENFSRFQKKYETKAAKRVHMHVDLSAIGDDIENVSAEGEQKSNIVEFLPVSQDSKREELTDVTEEIYHNLLFPMWQTMDGLNRYIKIIGKRIEQLIEQNRSEYYVMNNIRSVIINSGLINMLGRDYLIQYRYNEKHKTYIAYNILESKRDYLENGYTKEQTAKEIKPISFFDHNDDEIRKATLDDFDVSQRSLIHIIQERRERFPEELRDEPSEMLVSYLFHALKRGVRILQRDPSYVKPIYSGETGTISWLMPFHIKRTLIEEPELVIVIRKVDEFFEIKTILPYDDEIKDRITASALYSKIW